jgi:hypothetical protein
MAREFESIKGYKPNKNMDGAPITPQEMQHFLDFFKFLYNADKKMIRV